MSTPDGFQLGILPERKLDRRALAAGYSFLIFLIILMINAGWIWPDSMNIARQYHVTELIPMPSLQPEPLNMGGLLAARQACVEVMPVVDTVFA